MLREATSWSDGDRNIAVYSPLRDKRVVIAALQYEVGSIRRPKHGNVRLPVFIKISSFRLIAGLTPVCCHKLTVRAFQDKPSVRRWSEDRKIAAPVAVIITLQRNVAGQAPICYR